MAAAVGTIADVRARLSGEELYHWELTRRLNVLLAFQGDITQSFRSCMAKERTLTNALMLAETTLKLMRTTLEDHVPETMTTMRARIDTVFKTQERSASDATATPIRAFQGEKTKPYLDALNVPSPRCCQQFQISDEKIQQRLLMDSSNVFTYVPSNDDDYVKKRYDFLLKDGPRMEKRIDMLKRHLDAYDAWCLNIQLRILRVGSNYVRIKLLIETIEDNIYSLLPANNLAVKQNFEDLMNRAKETAEEQVDGIKKQRAEVKSRYNLDPLTHMQDPVGAVTPLDHWNAVGKRSSATPLILKDHVINYSAEMDTGTGVGDDDDDYAPSEESDEDGDRVERQQPQQPPAPLEELPDLGRNDPRRRSQSPRAPPKAGNPGDARQGAGASGDRRAGKRGPPGRGRGQAGSSSAPTVDAAILAAREKRQRKEKLQQAIQAIEAHVGAQLKVAEQKLMASQNADGVPTRRIVIEQGQTGWALMADRERLRDEWADYTGTTDTREKEAQFQEFYTKIYEKLETFVSELNAKLPESYDDDNDKVIWVGEIQTSDLLQSRTPEDLNTNIYIWAANRSNYQGKLGETVEGVARFKGEFVYTSSDIGIVMSPVKGLPGDVVQLSSDDDDATNAGGTLQELLRGGGAGSSSDAQRPRSNWMQGYIAEKEAREKRETERKQEAERQKREREEAEKEQRAAARKKAREEQDAAAQQAPPSLAGGGDGGAAELGIDEYGNQRPPANSDDSDSKSDSESSSS
jgi:hypothetical protein